MADELPLASPDDQNNDDTQQSTGGLLG